MYPFKSLTSEGRLKTQEFIPFVRIAYMLIEITFLKYRISIRYYGIH